MCETRIEQFFKIVYNLHEHMCKRKQLKISLLHHARPRINRVEKVVPRTYNNFERLVESYPFWLT